MPAYDVVAVDVRIGSTPTSPSRPSASAPTRAHAQASTSGGSPLSSSALMMKYVAQPTIAPSAHITPADAQVGARDQVEHQHQAERRQPAPASVIRPGRCPWRSHRKTTTAAGAVNSMRIAGPTCMCWTAEK